MNKPGNGNCELLDFYLPTIGMDWIEVRAICRHGNSVGLIVNQGPRIDLEPVQSDRKWNFFRYRVHGLDPATAGIVELLVNGMIHTLSFETLPIPAGQSKLKVGILTDLHLTGRNLKTNNFIRPSKRLYTLAEELTRTYLDKIEKQGADLIVFPGDTLDPCNSETIGLARELFSSVSIPCLPIIGNHEVWGPCNAEEFHYAFSLPPEGYHIREENGVRLVLLSTPDQTSLDPTRAQFRWLEAQLEQNRDCDTLIFAHFSLLLHPCVQGFRNDGMQQLYDSRAVLELLSRHPLVRVFVGGHKNVPSKILHNGILHLLCPQLIQAPCSYSIIEIYEGGMIHNVFEIEEQHYLQISREAFRDRYKERYGQHEDRNYYFGWK